MDAGISSHLGSFYQDVAAFQSLADGLEHETGSPPPAQTAMLGHGIRTLMLSADELESHLAPRAPELLRETQSTFRRLTSAFFCKSPNIERALTKPRGYAGDHALLDMYYTDARVSSGVGRALDDVLYSTPAVRAVVNRKEYVKRWIAARVNRRSCAKVIDLACGPCRLERDLFDAGRVSDASLIVVDQDPEALAYARRVLGPHADMVSFVHANAIQMARARAVPPALAGASFTVSLGLFDYLPRGIAVNLLRALRAGSAPGGELLVGNFARGNPTRTFMEWAADWVLIHRSDEEFLQLFLDAGFAPEDLTCERETEGGLVLMVTARVA
jgi:extracellular factor (EF) 3-hydroxypalmitic acid methyl ester biosynthesis protein